MFLIMMENTDRTIIHSHMFRIKLVVLKCIFIYKFRKYHKNLAIKILKQSQTMCHNLEEHNVCGENKIHYLMIN